MVKLDEKKKSLKILFLSLFLMKSRRKDIENKIKEKGLDITFPNLKVLYLLNSGSRTISDLSKHMMISSPTLVPMIDSLESKGFVKKESDPNDRRKNILIINDGGKKIISEIPVIGDDDAMLKAVSLLGDEKSLRLVELLEELSILIAEGDNKDLKEDIDKKIKFQLDLVK